MIQLILKLPEGETFADLSAEALQAVKAVNGQFPSGRVVNSIAIDGYEIKLIMCDLSGEALQNIIDYGYSINAEGEEVLVDLGLDWEVLADETEINDADLILPFLNDNVTLDENGDEVITPAKIESLQTYSGHKWIWL